MICVFALIECARRSRRDRATIATSETMMGRTWHTLFSRFSTMSTSHHGTSSRARSTRTGLLAPLLALIGLYWFSSSFFLAKRTLPFFSHCDEASTLLRDTLGLTESEISQLQERNILSSSNQGCWMDRRVDSIVILVVDALRFDFARHFLPQSVGSRLSRSSSSASSQLLQFVADPPTVTMQRLKGLTTGGLPTFADISASFGGATVDEDSWIQQLTSTIPSRRGYQTSKLAFVGDDTWIDLFPTQFEEAHPYPSFNTRDLDTVDNGCLEHLPRLLQSLRRSQVPEGFEVVVAHFLGVDHVGHTYGPHSLSMTQKLAQMDAALSTVLDLLDESLQDTTCHAALIFGDHGMTEDGNHGGGTQEEVNAALFVHFSPGCGDMKESMDITGAEVGSDSELAFQSIHQIDLVPTISLLLGLPIPYANLGGLVPSLLPPPRRNHTVATPYTAAALALNAAQVWRYFTVYSNTANKLPYLAELQLVLADAVSTYKAALAHVDGDDAIAYRAACGKFKLFLTEASELGHRVWTRFDTTGMIWGGFILFLALMLAAPWWGDPKPDSVPPVSDQYLESGIATVLMTFQCVLLTFSNSYIESEQAIVMFALAIIFLAIFCRGGVVTNLASRWSPLAIPVLSRISELFVTGHGLDPSIPLHLAHNSLFFLSSLAAIAVLRYHATRLQSASPVFHLGLDLTAILCLAVSWWEKRSTDPSRNGYVPCRLVLILAGTGTILAVVRAMSSKDKIKIESCRLDFALTVPPKLLIGIMAVTGPSTSSSVLLFILQSLLLFYISKIVGRHGVSAPILAALWRLLIRHSFFATHHACAFNRLQYSAAFVASAEFEYFTGGLSLFVNTFGWEMLGLMLLPVVSALVKRPALWRWYCFYQWLETFAACISVSLMRRHLMVWAVFAPRFLFAAIFLSLNAFTQILLFFV